MAIVKKLADTAEGRQQFELLSPANMEKFAQIECMTVDEMHAALARARTAQKSWAALSFEQRGEYILKALDSLMARQEELIDLVLKETPKPRNEILMMDIFTGADSMLYYAKKAKKFLSPERIKTHGINAFGKRLELHYQPLGVIGVISPWNAPFILSLNPTVQALMAGNAVMLKPSSATMLSGSFVAEIFSDAGLPKDLLTVVTGDGRLGGALVESDVDKISFTGGEEVGRGVGQSCAAQFKPFSLELGGKNAVIVCEDADLDIAAAGSVLSNYLNAGQFCGGTERVYVMDSVADEFIAKVVERVSALRQSDSGEFDIGSLYTQEQMDSVEAQVDDAIASGATVLCGGRRNPDLKGLYFEPTVLTDMNDEMRVISEETFGPVMSIMRVASEQEAIEKSNALNYGLTGIVFTRDHKKGVEIAKQLQTGNVDINFMPATYGSAEAPFGGRKASGVGQVNGAAGLRSYCYAMPIQIDKAGGKQLLSMYPKSLKDDENFSKFLKFLYATKIGRKIALMRSPF